GGRWRELVATPAAMGIVGTHGLREHVQSAYSSGCNADQQLLRPDLDQYCALFRAERDVRDDLDCASAGASEVAKPAHKPRRGEDCREHEHQRQRDLPETPRRT